MIGGVGVAAKGTDPRDGRDDEVKGGSDHAAVGEVAARMQVRAIATAPESPSQLVRPCHEGRRALPS